MLSNQIIHQDNGRYYKLVLFHCHSSYLVPFFKISFESSISSVHIDSILPYHRFYPTT